MIPKLFQKNRNNPLTLYTPSNSLKNLEKNEIFSLIYKILRGQDRKNNCSIYVKMFDYIKYFVELIYDKILKNAGIIDLK